MKTLRLSEVDRYPVGVEPGAGWRSFDGIFVRTAVVQTDRAELPLLADSVEKLDARTPTAKSAEHRPADAAFSKFRLSDALFSEQHSNFRRRIFDGGVFQHNRPRADMIAERAERLLREKRLLFAAHSMRTHLQFRTFADRAENCWPLPKTDSCIESIVFKHALNQKTRLKPRRRRS